MATSGKINFNSIRSILLAWNAGKWNNELGPDRCFTYYEGYLFFALDLNLTFVMN